MPEIQDDCYWYLEESTNRVRGACVECGGKHGMKSYWNGSEVGYGDYDLDCSICGKPIYRRKEDVETFAASEDAGE